MIEAAKGNRTQSKHRDRIPKKLKEAGHRRCQRMSGQAKGN